MLRKLSLKEIYWHYHERAICENIYLTNSKEMSTISLTTRP
jgi:hypothetical protein